jgi:hypothetical protein
VGSGNNGIIYRVCLAERPGEGEYALKMARESTDPRFEREAELLSRLAHPNVPGLKERGVWKAPWRSEYPYLVMQWVEGVPLYAWAARRGLTSRQALRVLAQVARALEATHALGIHRDVKGDNVYALGVTAYFLVTGTYPPPGTAPERCQEERRAAAPRMRPPSELATVAPELEALILRMLSKKPEARGAAGELANALEQAAEKAGPVADERVVPSGSMLPTGPAARSGPTRWHLARQALRGKKLLAVAGTLAAGVLAVVVLQPRLSLDIEEKPEQLATLAEEEEEDARVDERAVGLADGGVDESVLASAESRFPYGVPGFVLGEPIPKKPDPGQKKPPCNPADERAIHGGCWSHVSKKPPCEGFYEYDGSCYAPVQSRTRHQPTSEEP